MFRERNQASGRSAGPLSADTSEKPATTAALLKAKVWQLTALVRSLEGELSAERSGRGLASLVREVEELNEKLSSTAPLSSCGSPRRRARLLPVLAFDKAANLKKEIHMVVRDAEALRVECMGQKALVEETNNSLREEAAAKSELQTKIEDEGREIRDCYELIEHSIKAIEEENEMAEIKMESLNRTSRREIGG
ncbi:hypothetical protein HK101_010544 [Irineochytrium annulatum]|nr:hypothetical protein HK101_010544 [Irineochytrium annulatum]